MTHKKRKIPPRNTYTRLLVQERRIWRTLGANTHPARIRGRVLLALLVELAFIAGVHPASALAIIRFVAKWGVVLVGGIWFCITLFHAWLEAWQDTPRPAVPEGSRETQMWRYEAGQKGKGLYLAKDVEDDKLGEGTDVLRPGYSEKDLQDAAARQAEISRKLASRKPLVPGGDDLEIENNLK